MLTHPDGLDVAELDGELGEPPSGRSALSFVSPPFINVWNHSVVFNELLVQSFSSSGAKSAHSHLVTVRL